jgi:hypothetical protein
MRDRAKLLADCMEAGAEAARVLKKPDMAEDYGAGLFYNITNEPPSGWELKDEGEVKCRDNLR